MGVTDHQPVAKLVVTISTVPQETTVVVLERAPGPDRDGVSRPDVEASAHRRIRRASSRRRAPCRSPPLGSPASGRQQVPGPAATPSRPRGCDRPIRARNAASGPSPMSSVSRIATSDADASSRTRSNTIHMGVRSWSRRFIETWTQPIDAMEIPSACTAGSPPSRSLISEAIRRARPRSSVSSWMFHAMRNGRAPTTVAPAVGCARRGPKSGAPSLAASAADRPSKPGRRMSASTRRSNSSGGACIQEYRQGVPVCEPGAEVTGKPDAHVHRCAAQWDEGHHVQGADAGVPTVLRAQVDAGDGLRGDLLDGRQHDVRIPREREHAPGHGRRRRCGPAGSRRGCSPPQRRECVDCLGAAPLAEVGHAFNKVLLHGPECRVRRRPAMRQQRTAPHCPRAAGGRLPWDGKSATRC